MFNLFKKKTTKETKTEAKIETIFPTAQSMQEEAAKKWKTASNETILREIQRQSTKGERYVWIFNSYISEQTYKELEQQGYQITRDTHNGAPCFRVSW